MVIGLITLFDDYKSRSDDTKHTLKNNKYLTQVFGGQFIPANCWQGH